MNFYESSPRLDHGFIDLSHGHEMYFETYGNPNGIPVLVLHGGPGDSISYSKHQLIDPKKYYIIQYDQRGCGQSRPFADIAHNTTDYLVADIEILRQHLQVNKWLAYGSSWGSTLAMAYSAEHNDHVLGMIANGIFLGSREETENMFAPHGVAAKFFPDEYHRFIDFVPIDYKSRPIDYYGECFLSQDKTLRKSACINWCRLETTIMALEVSPEFIETDLADVEKLIPLAVLEHHYMSQDCFLDAEDLLQKLRPALADKPVHLVQGRYDIVCPPVTAWRVHHAIPHSQLDIIPAAGHWTKEAGTMAKLKQIFDEIDL